MARRLNWCLFLLAMFLSLVSTSVHAQQPRLVSSGTVAGPGVVTQGDWGIATTTVINPSTQDQTLLAAVTFTKDARMSNIQFAREFWIPAGSVREIQIPFRAPDFGPNTKAVDAQVQLLDTSGTSDVFLSRDVALYRASQTPDINVKVFAPKSAAGYELTGNLRDQLGSSQTYLTLKTDNIPTDASMLDNIEVILLGDDDPDLDPLQIEAIRQWILKGGQLIVILPETGMQVTRSILGEHLPMMLVDQSSQNKAAMVGSNVFNDGSMTTRISNKVRQPKNWNLNGLKDDTVDVHGGGTRFRNDSSSDRSIIDNTISISQQWASILVKGRMRVQSNNQASGAVLRFVFLDAAKNPIGDAVDLTNRVGTGWRDYEKNIDVPNGATQLKIEVGLENTKGTLWATGIQVIPAGMRFEEPVDFWRVLAPSMETDEKMMMDGWPMMYRGQMGRGRVTVLTLGSAYWNAASKAGSRVIDEAFRTHSRFNQSDHLVKPEILAQAGTQQIGYEVLSRTPVMASLLALLGIMIIAAIVFGKQGRPELLAPVSVVLAVVVAGVIWFMGMTHHRQTPLTVASVQLAQIDPISDYAITNAVVCTYSPSRLTSPLQATNGGVIWPDLSGSTGKLLRMRWTDLNQWQWDNLELPEATLRKHEIDRVIPLEQKVKAVASFNKEGMICTISSGPFAGVAHPIIASLNNHAVGKLTGHDNFTIVPDATLGLDQFVTTSTMTAQDIQRQEIYRNLIYPNSDALDVSAYPTEPSALWWARAMDMGFKQASDEARQQQQALVCVPLSYERPAPGTTFVIPSPVLQTDIFRDGGRGMSTVLNPMTGRWTSTISPEASFKLTFTVPKDLLPLKPVDGVLDIDFKTPGRSLIIRDHRGQEIATRKDLANRIQIPVKAENLVINRQGEIVLEFEVTMHQDPVNAHMWDASGGIRLQLTAVTE